MKESRGEEMEKWKASNNVFGSKVYRVESDEMDVAAFDPIQAERLAADLNELEAYREERHWRVIGEEWPEPGQYCQLGYVGCAEGETVAFAGDASQNIAKWVTCNHTEYLREEHGYTHWRPAPMDVPKEEE